MLLIRRALVYFLNLLNLFLFYLIFKKPEFIYYGSIILLFSTVLINELVIGRQEKIKEKFWFYGWFYVFWFSGISFLLILESLYFKYLLFFLLAVISFFYCQAIWYYYHLKDQYQPHTLVYVFNYSSLISLFFLTVSGFAFDVFLSKNFWLAPLIISFLAIFIFAQNMWFNKLDYKEKKRDLLIVWLLFTELILIFSWWPISYYVKAGLVAISYFLITNFLISRSVKDSRSISWYYLLIIFITIIILLLTARWY